MQLQVKIDSWTHIITVPDSFSDGQVFKVKIGGNEHSIRWHRLLDTFFLVGENGVEQPMRLRNFTIRSFADDPETTIQTEIGTPGSARLQCSEATVQRHLPGHDSKARSGEKKAQVLRSQITGKVLKVLVSEGQDISPNEPLIIIEAMKMENKIFAKVSGKVSGIKVKEGALVSTGDELLRIG